MGQKKLIKFAAIKQYENVLEYPQGMPGKWKAYFEKLAREDYPISLDTLEISSSNSPKKNASNKPLVLELACGRGEYAVGLARLFPEQNFLGLDIKGNRIWKGASIANKEGIKNVAFVRTQIEQSIQYFAKEEVAEIWITFPDPQLRLSKAKKRLTHPQFLRLYQQFLQPGGIVHLKTDSPNLYLFTKTVIELYGLTLLTATDDVYGTAFLQSDKWDERYAIKTYYEGLNIASSNRIHYIQFKIDKVLPKDKDETLKEMIAAFEVTETHDAKRERGVKVNEN
ncbi:MAG: tRNA (guanosine(46)-N7)-methyltransferase TrmB [Chitinophagaceae bacterium]|nr:tRNA (guanosine(46)-N7)-methyltransferase TrmB [Chitinophagaceae bacterium]